MNEGVGVRVGASVGVMVGSGVGVSVGACAAVEVGIAIVGVGAIAAWQADRISIEIKQKKMANDLFFIVISVEQSWSIIAPKKARRSTRNIRIVGHFFQNGRLFTMSRDETRFFGKRENLLPDA